jgi:dihydrofolate reductase
VIRAIAAIDDRRGLGTDTGIPWTVPADVVHFRAATAGVDVLMGFATYSEFDQPMPGRVNYVATASGRSLRDGFRPVGDVSPFLTGDHPGDLWVIGGAGLYASTLALTDELWLTRVAGDFDCTKFFPVFEGAFELVSDDPSPPVTGVPPIRFQTWRRTGGTGGVRPT